MTSNQNHGVMSNWATERARRGAEKSANARRGKPKNPHPLTADVLYEDDQFEFIQAIQRFQAATGTKFPTWSQTLSVLKSLGYSKTASSV